MVLKLYTGGPRPRGRRRRSYSKEAVASAKARQEEFVALVLPLVQRRARRRFWDWGEATCADMQQEAAGLAWLNFVAFCQNHPGEKVGIGWAVNCATWVLLRLLRGSFLCAPDLAVDVLSRRCRAKGRVRLSAEYKPANDHRILVKC